jgi:putative oxidoreductase
MSLARRAARAALAASFISGGLDQLRNPQSKAGPASPIAKPIAERVPQLPDDPESLVRLDGAIKVLGGTALIFGPFARPAALLLAGSLVPTTLAGHRFWETTDPDQKVSDRVEFFKNVSLIGGLLIAALDTGGRPSIPWVAGKAVQGAAETVGEAAETVGHAVQGVTGTVAGAAGTVAGAAGTVAQGAGRGRRLGRRRAARRADKAARVADALKVAAAAKAVKAARKAEKTRSGKRSDRAAKARAAKAGAAAVTAGAAAKGAAASARTAAKETALAAKEKVGAVVSH